MQNSMHFYKGTFLHVILVRIIVQYINAMCNKVCLCDCTISCCWNRYFVIISELIVILTANMAASISTSNGSNQTKYQHLGIAHQDYHQNIGCGAPPPVYFFFFFFDNVWRQIFSWNLVIFLNFSSCTLWTSYLLKFFLPTFIHCLKYRNFT